MKDDFTSTAWPVAAATLLSMLGIGMLVPALPHLASEGASSGVAAGALISGYGLSRLFCNTPSGIVVDRLGISRSAFIGLLALAAVSVFGYFADNVALLFATMVLQGAASSLFSTAAMTALMLKAGPKGRGRAMAWFQTALLLGFSLGPVIGGQVVERFGAHAPFPIQAVIALLALVVMRAMPMTPLVERAPGAATQPAVKLGSLIGPALVIGGIGGFAAFFSRFGVAWNVVPVAALQQFHLTTSELGTVIGVATLANLAVMPFLGKLVDGWGARPTFIVAAALNIASMLALYVFPSLPMLWLATGGVMLATGVMLPAAGAIALTNAKPQMMGRIMGLYRTVAEAGMAFGPAVVPSVTAAVGMPVLGGMLTCSLVTVVALVAALMHVTRIAPVSNAPLRQQPAQRSDN
jgi:MFS family permease